MSIFLGGCDDNTFVVRYTYPLFYSASQTMLFHLSSFRETPSKKSKEERTQDQSSTFPHRQAIASRVMGNLSSLTYHHLSPNTVMQSRGRTAFEGGSDSKHMRQIRSKRDLKRKARDRINKKGSMEGALFDDEEVADMGARMITSLLVPPRRKRGPILGPPDARQFVSKQWNGQVADGSLRESQHVMNNTKQSLDQLENRIESLKQDLNNSEKRRDKEELEKAMKTLRSERKAFAAKERHVNLTNRLQNVRINAASVLHDVVQKAEFGTGACLGSARIGKLARGEWLQP